MKKLVSAMLLAGMFLGVSNAAISAQKIAVVDIPAVVSQSKAVKSLKDEQQKKIRDLEKWLNTAKADIDKQQTKEGKEKLIVKYNDEFAKRKDAIIKDYQERLQAADKSITEAIAAQAKLKGYDLILPKNIVVYGGDDITADIQKAIK